MNPETDARPYALRPCTVVYLTLITLTGVTWLVGQSGLSGLGMSLPILALALLKGQLVGDFFMGLKGIRSAWRWVISLWLLLPGVLIAIAFVMAG